MKSKLYRPFINDDQLLFIPDLSIPISDSDEYISWNKSEHRLDLLSYNYYGTSEYGLLILFNNREYGSDEFDFKDNDFIRIPYPLNSALERYNKKIRENFIFHGK